MFCSECGMENGSQEKVCRLCQADLRTSESFVPEKIYIDITRIPFVTILKSSIKLDGWGKILFSLPIFTILYFIRKISRTPLPQPRFSSSKMLIRPVLLESVEPRYKDRLQPVTDYLKERGYEFLMDYELLMIAQKNLNRLMFNPDHKTYALIAAGEVKGTIKFVSFIGIWKNFYYTLLNAYGLPLQVADNVVQRHEGGFSLEKTYQTFLEETAEIDRRRGAHIKVGLGNLFRIYRRVQEATIKKGLEQGIFISEKEPGRAVGTGAIGTSTCYHHQSRYAVRQCTGCGHPLCEACIQMVDGQPYCETCLPLLDVLEAGDAEVVAGEDAVMDESVNEPDQIAALELAGFGTRVAAALVDMGVINLSVILVSVVGISLANLMHFSKGPIVLLSLVFGGAFTFYYFIPAFQKTGRTLGHRLFGLRVIDETGQPLDIRAAVIRFGYFLISILFVFPLIGFIALLFNKKKQGWHDRLAGTLVVGRGSWPRTIGAWVTIIAFAGLFYSLVIGGEQAMFPLFKERSINQAMAEPDPQLFVQPVWTRVSEDGYVSGIWGVGEETVLTTFQEGLAMLDLATGRTIWTNPDITDDYELFGAKYHDRVPFLMMKWDDMLFPEKLVAVDGETGSAIWQKTFQYSERELEDVGEIWGWHDEKTIVTFSEKGLATYDMADGTLLWETSFGDGCALYDLSLNQHVIVELTCGESGITRVLDEMNGGLLWELADHGPRSSFNLTPPYELFHDESMALYLADLNEKRIIWKSDQPVGQVLQERSYLREQDAMPEFLAIGNVILDMNTGKVTYLSPKTYQALGYSDRYGIFYNLREAVNPNGKKLELIVVEKGTGKKVGDFTFPGKGMMRFAGEDERFINLFFDQGEYYPGMAKTNFGITFDKIDQSFDIRKIGKDHMMAFFEYIPGIQKLLIPGEDSIGLYEWPGVGQDQASTSADSGKSR